MRRIFPLYSVAGEDGKIVADLPLGARVDAAASGGDDALTGAVERKFE